jgi:hypothetical protein
MNWITLFQDSRRKVLRLAEIEASRGHWAEVLRLTETKLPPAPSPSMKDSRLYADLLFLHLRAKENVWKTADLTNTAILTDAVLDDLLFSIFTTEIDHFGARPGWVFFLGQQLGSGPVEDVPPSLLNRFPSAIVRPIGRAKRLGTTGVEDIETKEKGTTYVVQVFGWIDPDTVKIGVDSFTGGLFAHGYLAVAHKTSNQWSVGQKISEWQS